jgi:hypothetical protein
MVPAAAQRQSVGRAAGTSLDGWNLGKPPVGYLGEKHPHPNPIKAAEGRTKTRLIEDPVYGPVIGLIYKWRVSERLGKPTIRARLAAGPHRYPPPGPAGWSLALVDEILSNPKYTGHQMMGRRRRKGGKKIWTPPDEWIRTPEPTHPALVDKAVWDAAQRMGRRHGNVRDPEMPPAGPAAATSSVPACTAPSATAASAERPSARTPTTAARTSPASRATTPPTPATAPSPSAKTS